MSETLNHESCGTCKFYRRNPRDLQQGFCRIRSPQIHIVPVKTPQGLNPHPVAMFPNMDKDDWCGEWKGRILQ